MSGVVFALVSLIAAVQPGDGLTQDVIRQSFDRYSKAVCLIEYSLEITNPRTGDVTNRDNTAVGLVVSPDGLVLAHGHMVIEDRKPFNIKVTIGEGVREREYPAELLDKPDDVNVALLRIERNGEETFPYMQFEQDHGLELGAPVFSIGVLSESFDFARSIQTRRVGAAIEQPRETYALDQPISFGYVGGPVFDAAGRPIGVVGFDLATSEGGELYTRSGYPLIYQASLFQKYIDKPPSEEAESAEGEAWIGVFTQPLTDDLADYWDLEPTGGVVVSTVIPGSPAADMGLQSGDVLVEFNGVPMTPKQDQEVLRFTKLVRESPVDQPLPVKVLRDGEPMKLTVTLRARPTTSRDADEYEDEELGMVVRELTTDVRIALNLSSGVEGVIVRRVTSGSPANQAGINPGFLVLRLNQEPVTSIADYQAAIAKFQETKPAEVIAFCRVGAGTAFFRLLPRWE